MTLPQQPVPQPDPNAPPEPANPPAAPVAQPTRVPFAELIQQRADTGLIGRIAPRLYTDFEQGIVDAIAGEAPAGPTSANASTPTGEPGGEGAGADGVASSLPPSAPPTPTEPEQTFVVNGRTVTASELQAALSIADQATHLQPILDHLSSGDYVLAPKGMTAAPPRVEQPAPAPLADPIDAMIEQYEQTDPQAAQILRVMQSRSAAERARFETEIAGLRGSAQQSEEVQQANGLNRGVRDFATQMQLDEATVNQLAAAAGQTGYLPMMMQRRFDEMQQRGLPIDMEQLAHDSAIELLTFQRNMSMPASAQQQFAPQPAPPAPSPSQIVPPTSQAPVPMSEAEIEARVQARVAAEIAQRDQRAAQSALVGGSSGTPGFAPASPDLGAMTPQQRRAYHDKALVDGIATLQRNGTLGGGGWS